MFIYVFNVEWVINFMFNYIYIYIICVDHKIKNYAGLYVF